MTADPSQMENHLAGVGGNKTYFERPEKQLYNRLDALLMVTKSCEEETCRNPWSVLFPGAEVTSLADSMQETYDQFFQEQPKVEFGSCKCDRRHNL